MKLLLKTARLLGLAVAGMLGVSCSQVGDSWMFGSMAAAAKDQIMLVRKEPPSFGYQRLEMQSRVYPDLRFFVSKHGLPDFLAETGERNRQYFILYYLRDREAFACRTTPRRGIRSNLPALIRSPTGSSACWTASAATRARSRGFVIPGACPASNFLLASVDRRGSVLFQLSTVYTVGSHK